MNARDAIDAATAAFDAAGCSTPRLDAELMIADALGVGRERLFLDPEMEIPPAAARVIAERVRRRNEREPVAYILGHKGFRNIELKVDRRALVPRPESELLVEAALDLPEGARVHDVGTGTGAIALALLDERPDLHVTASELSPEAAELARENAELLGLPLEVEVADGLPPGEYDLVIANLPYVRDDRWDILMPEINRYEPRVALTGGMDGLDAIRELVEAALDLPEGARVHDVGTGTGAIALALLDERPDLRVTASEVSTEAAELARENAERLGLPLEVEVADGLPPGEYDLVIANLPYVRDDRWDRLMPEINRYEPRVALTGGADGLDAIRELIAAVPSGTRVALEHADDQAEAVRELLEDAVSYPDLANWDRITVGRVP